MLARTAGLDDQPPGNLGNADAPVPHGEGGSEHVRIEDLRPPAGPAAGCRGLLSFHGLFAAAVAVKSGRRREHGEQHRSRAFGVI